MTIKMLEYNFYVLLVYILIMFVLHALIRTCVMCFSNFVQGYTILRFIFGILLFSNIIRILCIVVSYIVSIMTHWHSEQCVQHGQHVAEIIQKNIT